MGRITNISGGSASGEKLSLEEFRHLSQQHLLSITQTHSSLREVSTPFEGRGNVLPIHCSAALNSLDELNEQFEDFENLLYSTASLPDIITALRSEVLFILHRVEKHSARLEKCLKAYLVMCFRPSRTAQRLKAEIDCETGHLLQCIEECVLQTKMLNDEAMFEEKGMVSLALE